MPYEFTYLMEHGSASEMIDRALGIIEGWADRAFIVDAEAAGHSEIYGILGRVSLKDKLDVLIPEGVEGLEVEYGSRYIWQWIYDMIALRPEMDAAHAESKLQTWLDAQGWNDPTLDLPKAPEPLQTELVLRTLLDGSLIYLDAWFESLGEVTA